MRVAVGLKRRLTPTTIQGWLKYAMIGIALLIIASLEQDYMSMELIFGAFLIEVALAACVLYFDWLEKKEGAGE